MKFLKRGLIAVMLIFAAVQWGEAFWILGKAQLAQALIASAWQTTQQKHTVNRPWAWADTWPVARLQWQPTTLGGLDKIEEDMYVLAGAHGEALAFGPGHLHGTAKPGTGLSVIAGHRDTHFDFLEHVRPDDVLNIQAQDGKWTRYQVQSTEVRHIDRDPLTIEGGQEGLLLITCYPFNSLVAGGPHRYLVWATPLESRDALSTRFVAPTGSIVF